MVSDQEERARIIAALRESGGAGAVTYASATSTEILRWTLEGARQQSARYKAGGIADMSLTPTA